ncbi:hypothetical protein B0J18DRAFT_303235 [Chaetomium sp. MPI-SDFR-AT-0129]|nr:hypothetical protein B0J18DRAFT_303235 [Chaetomium sp. MPI-SDFR-AT-0129]
MPDVLAAAPDWLEAPEHQQLAKLRGMAQSSPCSWRPTHTPLRNHNMLPGPELHYFSQPQQLDDIDEEELSEEEKALPGYQALCHEVGIDPSDSVAECKRNLKNTLAAPNPLPCSRQQQRHPRQTAL